jgi:hypothetical protein
MRPAEVIERYGEPTHPLVIPPRFGKGEGFAHLPLIAQATRAVMSFHDTRVDLFIPEQVQHMVETRFPPDHLDDNRQRRRI